MSKAPGLSSSIPVSWIAQCGKCAARTADIIKYIANKKTIKSIPKRREMIKKLTTEKNKTKQKLKQKQNKNNKKKKKKKKETCLKKMAIQL